MRPDPAVMFWEGDKLELGPGLTLLRLGGHFAGAQVLHWGWRRQWPGRAARG
jgi:glyoxylase-like metal-dependent hydrolase (beta-lactamase superfamily II)